MRPQAILNYLLGVTEGLVMYSIYSDYANKLNSPGTWKEFGINEDGYVPKSYETIADFTGLLPDTIRGVIERLIKKGLLQKKPGNVDTYNIPYYKPVLESGVFINLAKERLKTPPKNKLNQKSDERFIPEIIETLEKDQSILGALGLVKSSQETKSSQEPKSSHESNPPEEEDLNLIVWYFKCCYENKYNMDYNPTDREIERLRNIINNYSMDQWQEMILIFIQKYSEQWKSSKYPYPTIFGLTQDWILEGLKAMCS